MLMSEELWRANDDLTYVCLNSSFIKNLANGSLPKSEFVHYLQQESFCQQACARVYGIAAAKAPDWEGFSTLHQLMGESVSSLRVRHQTALKWGEVIGPAAAPNPVIQRYTDFLVSIAWNQELGSILAALTPRFRLIHSIGQSLTALGLQRHVYGDWILNAGSPRSGQVVQLLEGLLNRYVTKDSQQFSNYRHALLCERDFLNALDQTVAPESPVRLSEPSNRYSIMP